MRAGSCLVDGEMLASEPMATTKTLGISLQQTLKVRHSLMIVMILYPAHAFTDLHVHYRN